MFIVFEGPDKSGKTTLLNDVVERLEFEGYDVIKSLEPGGTKVGKKIREVILNNDLDNITQSLLYAADRSLHFKEKLSKIKDDEIFITDRYMESTVVYQHMLGGLDPAAIRFLHSYTTNTLLPDKTYIISSDVPHGEPEHKNDKGEFRAKQVDLYKGIHKHNGNLKACPWSYNTEIVDTTDGEWDDYLNFLVGDIKEAIECKSESMT